MSWRELYWGWEGRLNRLQFILGAYSLGIVSTVMMMVLVPLVGPPAPAGGYIATPEVWTIIIITQLAPLPLTVSMAVRRLHDLNYSGRWLLALPTLVALDLVAVGIWPAFDESPLEVIVIAPVAGGLLLSFFRPGQACVNRFGPPPQPGWLP